MIKQTQLEISELYQLIFVSIKLAIRANSAYRVNWLYQYKLTNMSSTSRIEEYLEEQDVLVTTDTNDSTRARRIVPRLTLELQQVKDENKTIVVGTGLMEQEFCYVISLLQEEPQPIRRDTHRYATLHRYKHNKWNKWGKRHKILYRYKFGKSYFLHFELWPQLKNW